MADRSRKVAEKRRKREQKRRQIHKMQSGSPAKQAAAGEVVECWINACWQQEGQTVPYIVRRMPGGKVAFAEPDADDAEISQRLEKYVEDWVEDGPPDTHGARREAVLQAKSYMSATGDEGPSAILEELDGSLEDDR